MHIAYVIISSFPFWAIPLGFLLLEQANRSRVRDEKGKMAFAGIMALIFLVGSGAFFYYGGQNRVGEAFRLYKENRVGLPR